MDYQVLAYYSLERIEDPAGEVARHKEFLSQRDFKGRIYLSEQGINGQASGQIGDAAEYRAWMEARFQKISFKIHPASEHAYEKMIVKERKQLVALDCEVDFSQRGEPVATLVMRLCWICKAKTAGRGKGYLWFIEERKGKPPKERRR